MSILNKYLLLKNTNKLYSQNIRNLKLDIVPIISNNITFLSLMYEKLTAIISSKVTLDH